MLSFPFDIFFQVLNTSETTEVSWSEGPHEKPTHQRMQLPHPGDFIPLTLTNLWTKFSTPLPSTIRLKTPTQHSSGRWIWGSPLISSLSCPVVIMLFLCCKHYCLIAVICYCTAGIQICWSCNRGNIASTVFFYLIIQLARKTMTLVKATKSKNFCVLPPKGRLTCRPLSPSSWNHYPTSFPTHTRLHDPEDKKTEHKGTYPKDW